MHPPTWTDKLNTLLERFEDTEEEMRTFTDAPKTATLDMAMENASKLHRQKVGDAFTTVLFAENGGVDRKRIHILGDPGLISPMPRSEPMEPRRTALALVPPAPPSTPEIEKFHQKHKHRAHELYSFNPIKASSFVCTSSPTGNYTEMVCVLWMDKVNRSTALDRYRLVLNFLYDAEENIWGLSAKLIRRSHYSTTDYEEGFINTRLCLTHELRSEAKKMLLYLNISPIEAYRLFRRNMEEGLIISRTTDNFLSVENTSHANYMRELEKTTSTTSCYDQYPRGGYPHVRDYRES